ncbi:hypothetical protein LR69_00480 [Geobacillus sp. BCO2]|nr:hypothetical protein LR69_00480 [Geobacillus sp. BCO2]
MIFKVFYQENVDEVPVREKTKNTLHRSRIRAGCTPKTRKPSDQY